MENPSVTPSQPGTLDRVFLMECRAIKPGLWHLILQKVNPTGYCHTALVVDDVLYELDGRMRQSVLRWKFYSFKDAKDHIEARYGTDFEIEFYRLPGPLTDSQVQKIHEWWEDKIAQKMGYGWLALVLAVIDIPRRKLQARWFKFTGRLPISILERMGIHQYQCMSAASTSIKEAGIDITPDQSECLDYPGDYAVAYPKLKVFPWQTSI